MLRNCESYWDKLMIMEELDYSMSTIHIDGDVAIQKNDEETLNIQNMLQNLF